MMVYTSMTIMGLVVNQFPVERAVDLRVLPTVHIWFRGNAFRLEIVSTWATAFVVAF